MPGEPVTEPEDEPNFQETLAKSKRFTMRGCTEEGKFRISKNLANFIYNISGYCTDPSEKTLYNKPKAMFEALDLIYKAFDEIQCNPQTNECECGLKFKNKEGQTT